MGKTHIVEAEEDTPEGKEHPCHHEHVWHVAESSPIHFRATAAAPARALSHDEVGREQGEKGDEGDDCKN